MRTHQAKYESNLIENQFALEIDSVVKGLVRLIPNVCHLIAPILNFALIDKLHWAVSA